MLGRHLLYYLPVNVAQAVVGFGAIFVLTRILSPADYGLYALALAATHLIHTACFAWLDAAAARFHARADRRGRLADHFAGLFAAWAAIAALFCVIAAAGLWLAPIPDHLKTLAGFTAGALVARSAMRLFQESRRAAHEAERYGVLESIYVLGAFGLGIGLILATPMRAAGPFAGMLVAAAICVLIDAPSMLRKARGGRVQTRRVRAYAGYGAPLALSLILALMIESADRFMIMAYLGESAVGVYTAGYQLSARTLDIIFVWLGMAAGPLAVSALERRGKAEACATIRMQGETMILIALPAAVGLALVADPLSAVMTGEEFRAQAALIAPWIAIAAFLGGFTTYYLDQALELSRKTYLTPVVLAAPAAANIVLNMILLPRFGLLGAVAASVVAYAGGAVFSAWIGLRHFPLPLPLSALWRTALACGAMAAAVWMLPDFSAAWLTLLVHAALGAAVFAAAALALDAGPARPLVAELVGRARRYAAAKTETMA